MDLPNGSKLAVDSSFAMWGKDATYTAPGSGSPLACRVILREKDEEATDFGLSGRPVTRGRVIEVRASEIATPARDGVFNVGANALKVVSDPRADDDERLVWILTVQ